jgi:Tfp pilus assembly protein PilN
MIEINLLPDEMKRPEGTPLPRLLSIMASVILMAVGGLLISKYYVVEIPKTKELIRGQEGEKKRLQQEVARVEALDKEIEKIKAKVAAWRSLENSRILYARFLDVFSRAVPEGCVITSFTLAEDRTGTGGEGKHFKISLSGMTVGNSQQDCQAKLRETINDFKKTFQVADKKPVSEPLPGAKEALPGYHKFLGLKFEEPRILKFTPRGSPPSLMGVNENDRKRFAMPESSLDFSMSFGFAMKPQGDGQNL